MKKILESKVRRIPKKSKDKVEDLSQDSNSTIKIVANEKIKEELEKPQALRNLVSSALGLGFMGWLITSGKVDYNASYDFSNLPHKFAKICEVIKGVDFNKIKLGKKTMEMVFEFWNDRNKEKENGISLVEPITFKMILQNLRDFPLWNDVKSAFSPSILKEQSSEELEK